MSHKSYKPSRGMLISIAVIILFYLTTTANKRTIEKAEDDILRSYEDHYETVVSSLEETSIDDQNLKQCIRRVVIERARINPQNSGAISHASDIRLLSCFKSNIRSLSGIEEFTNLRHLDISYNNITDLTPLKDHPSLQTINIKNNPISGIHILKTMPNLHAAKLPELRRRNCSEIDHLMSNINYNKSQLQCIKDRDLTDTATNKKQSKKSTGLSEKDEMELMDFEFNY